MHTLAGKDIGLTDCGFVANGEVVQEVLEKMVEHIEKEHLMEWEKLERGMDLEAERDFLIRHVKDDDMSPI